MRSVESPLPVPSGSGLSALVQAPRPPCQDAFLPPGVCGLTLSSARAPAVYGRATVAQECLLSSVGQSTALVKRGSSVRIRQGAPRSPRRRGSKTAARGLSRFRHRLPPRREVPGADQCCRAAGTVTDRVGRAGEFEGGGAKMNIYTGGFFGIRCEFRRWRRTDMDRPVERAVLAAGQGQGAAGQNNDSAKPFGPRSGGSCSCAVLRHRG